MEHIVQFAINIDDKAISDRVDAKTLRLAKRMEEA